MKPELTELLAACLDKLDHHELTLEEILDLYPEAREELEPLLRTADVLHDSVRLIRPEFKDHSPARLMNSLADLQTPLSQQSRFPAQKHFPIKLAWGVSALLGFAFLTFIGSGTVYASTNSIPGDILYPVKLAVEDVRLFVASDEKDMQLQMEYLQTRLNEIDQLIEEDRKDDLLLAQDTYIETLENAAAVLKKNAIKENNGNGTKVAEYETYLKNQSTVLSELINSVPPQAQPALQSILDKTKKNQDAINDLITDNESSEDKKNKPEKNSGTVTPETYPTEPNETPAPKEKSNNGKNDDKDSASELTTSVTHGPPDKDKTKNPNVPTKKTK